MSEPITSAPSDADILRDDIACTSIWRKLGNLIGTLASAGKNLFSITALLVVIGWAAAELQGLRPNDTTDKVLSLGVIILMVFEIWKTTSSHQLSKKSFFLDLITGVLEFTVYWVATSMLIRDEIFDYRHMLNWTMLIFVSCDALLVPFNRYVLVFRQITSVPDDSGGGNHHDKDRVGHAVVTAEHSGAGAHPHS